MDWGVRQRSLLAIAAALIAVMAGFGNAKASEANKPVIILAQNEQAEDGEEENRKERRKERGNREERREKRKERREERAEKRGDRREERKAKREERKEERRQNAEQRRDRKEERRQKAQDRSERREAERSERRERREAERTQRKEEQRERAERRQQKRQAEREKRREEKPQRAEKRREAGEDKRERGEKRRDRREAERDDRRENRRERREAERDGRRENRRERRERREAERAERRENRRERAEKRREFTGKRLKDITQERRRREDGGRVILEEPGNRRIIREGGRAIIEHDDTQRLRASGRDVRVEEGRRGRTRTIITRPNGVEIITVRNRHGRLLRRIKRLPNGREIVLINNQFENRRGRRFRDDDDRGLSFVIRLPNLAIDGGSRRDYYAYADRADEDEIYDVLSAPPVEALEEDYTLDEIRYSPDIRERLRKINLNTVTFESGSWEVPYEQIDRLEVVANVINRIVDEDQDQVILVAGHTDAVGSDENNLSLSDRRAETVARILTDEFSVPPENLVTQGYGESDLLIDTSGDEARNRRVEFMRITPYLAQN